MYRLVVVDLDGTLLGPKGEISAPCRRAVARANRRGIGVSLCSGRPKASCAPFIRELGLERLPHIFYDGAMVSRLGQEPEFVCPPLRASLVEELVAFARPWGLALELYTQEGYYVEGWSTQTSIQAELLGVRPVIVDFSRLIQDEAIIKAELVLLGGQRESVLAELRRVLKGRLRLSPAKALEFPQVDFINITQRRVSKGSALVALARALGIGLEQVAAIGDGLNDIPMLRRAGLGVAMGNAPERVKRAAARVTLDVAQDGVAFAMESLQMWGET